MLEPMVAAKVNKLNDLFLQLTLNTHCSLARQIIPFPFGERYNFSLLANFRLLEQISALRNKIVTFVTS